MKIMMITDSYPPRLGGMERYVSNLSKELTLRNHEVTVCVPKDTVNRFSEKSGNINVVRCSSLFNQLPFIHNDLETANLVPIPDLLLSRELKKQIDKVNPDIIDVHGWILYSLLPLQHKIPCPIVTTLHDYRFICPKTTLLQVGCVCNKTCTSTCTSCSLDVYNPAQALFVYPCVKLQRASLHKVDKIISVSSFVKKTYMDSLQLPDSKIAIIPNFYKSKTRQPNHSENSNSLPEDFVLYVGLLSPSKGVGVLIEAFKKIKNTKLVLIGKKTPEGTYKSSGNVIVIENAPDDLLMEAYLRCKFVVMPSVWPDPCPTVAFEAMAAKKAIVASAVGGLTDIVVDGTTGLLAKPGSSESLRTSIERLLRDDELASVMGNTGYERLTANFSADVVVPEIECLFASLTSK